MSSSNLVSVRVIPETVYGETPVAGNFKTARFTSESLSGTPGTTESQQIRTDRMSSGQIVTGLSVGGELGFELAKESSLEDFLSSVMLNDWDTKPIVNVDLTIDAAAKEISRAAGSFTADEIVVGDFITLAGFGNSKNNVTIMVAELVDTDIIRYVGPVLVSQVGNGTSFKRADKLTIGTSKKSFSIEKAFLDLTDKAIVYRGMMANTMQLKVAFGDLISGSFGFNGNGYETVDEAAKFITNGRTILPAATTNTFNGSVDMPFLGSSAIGELDESGLDIQSVSLDLNNNYSPQNVIGNIAPKDYSPGTASIEVSLSAYFKDSAWPMLARKLNQASFALGWQVRNQGGFYAFYLPAIQVSFDDPSSGGQNQDISLEMQGRAKVGDNGESALVIYRST